MPCSPPAGSRASRWARVASSHILPALLRGDAAGQGGELQVGVAVDQPRQDGASAVVADQPLQARQDLPGRTYGLDFMAGAPPRPIPDGGLTHRQNPFAHVCDHVSSMFGGAGLRACPIRALGRAQWAITRRGARPPPPPTLAHPSPPVRAEIAPQAVALQQPGAGALPPRGGQDRQNPQDQLREGRLHCRHRLISSGVARPSNSTPG